MKRRVYQCKMCKGVFRKNWSDEEAEKEMKSDFGDVSKEERIIICDDCYNQIKPSNNPMEFLNWYKENKL